MLGDISNPLAGAATPSTKGATSAWAIRANMWRGRFEKTVSRRTKRARAPAALVLAGHGVSLRINGGALEIKNGLTHYPQTRETYVFFRGDLELPERIILLDGSGSLSFEVLSWLSEQNVPLVRLDWRGGIVCATGTGYSANPHRVQWQYETRDDPDRRMEFCRSIITKKIEASVVTLEKTVPRSDRWERAMKAAYAGLSALDSGSPGNVMELRALEANCAAAYFRAWRGTPLKWRGTSRRPVPANWAAIEQRSSAFHLAGSRNAAHPVNALLNYAYTVLESETRIRAISEGYDPTIGIMHEGRDGSSKFIFDMMEPERPKVDRAILDFVKSTAFDPADFTIRTDGVVRLNPELARYAVGLVQAAIG